MNRRSSFAKATEDEEWEKRGKLENHKQVAPTELNNQ
jgi:hypothetical protein